MPYTRSFTGYSPPRRYDSLPFVSAAIRESATEAGTYSTVETIALSPVDTDPSVPASRSFTTNDATLANGWYIIRWLDAAGSIFDSDAVDYAASGASGSETETKARLGRMTDSSTEPTLSSTDLNDLLGFSARADADGLYRDEDGWVPTWDLNAGAAEGWARKSSKAASNFNFAEDGQRFDRAQVYQHCMSQHTIYANKGMGVIT